MSYTTYLNKLKDIRNSIVMMLNRFNIISNNEETISTLVAKFPQIATDTTATENDIALGKTAYINGNKVTGTFSDAVRTLVNSITVSGTYSDATYYSLVDAYYNVDGNLALVMKSGTNTSYENLYFVLSSVPAGVSLVGQSVYNYSSASAGQYYVAIISGIANKVDIAIDMSTRNSTSDYVQCNLTITEVQGE